MSDNRNTSLLHGRESCGTVCIDTNRVFDSCRDRDCFENTRVYLTMSGEEILASATNIRTREAKILSAYVGVSEVPFNCGFYQVTIRYYVGLEFEACTGIGKGRTFYGISVLEKNVVLYGGEGSVSTFSSNPENDFCSLNTDNRGSNDPIAIVETVEPLVLGTKIEDCSCQCCNNCECVELPEIINEFLGGTVCTNNNSMRLYVSLGIFSVIRIVRPVQILVNATDYSVPDKECIAATNDEEPCAVFRNMPFPISRFGGTSVNETPIAERNRIKHGGCCGK